MKWSAWIAVTFASASVAAGQKCEIYRDALVDGTQGFCAGLVTAKYFLPLGASQEFLEVKAMEAVMKDAATKQMVSLLPPGCQAQLKKTACMAVFKECEYVNLEVANYKGDTTLSANNETDCLNLKDTIYKNNLCYRATPRSRCAKEACWDNVGSTLEPDGKLRLKSGVISDTCPPVTGLFFLPLMEQYGKAANESKLDGYKALEVKSILGSCLGKPLNDLACNAKLFTLNALVLLGADPDCLDTNNFARNDVGQLFKPRFENQVSPKTGNDSCGVDSSGKSVTCKEILDLGECAAPSDAGPNVQRSLEMVPEESECYNFIRHPSKQDPFLNHALATVDFNMQISAQKAVCLAKHKLELYPGIYVVPPRGGMAPLAQRIDKNSREQRLESSWNTVACPIRREPSTLFQNFDEIPLCTVNGKNYANARDCLQAEVDKDLSAIPKTFPFRCRNAILELSCSARYLKPQLKSLCLVPTQVGGCDQNQGRYALEFFLPRFPSQSMCEKVNDECRELIDAKLMSATQCDAKINVVNCSNADLQNGVWKSTCASSFNGLSLFPKGAQRFGSIASLGKLGDYVALVQAKGLTFATDFNQLFLTDVQEPGKSRPLHASSEGRTESQTELRDLQVEFCKCPYPLLVPKSPDGKTVSPVSCCAFPCRGSMSTEDDAKWNKRLQILLSLVGTVCALFLVVTWGTFAQKSKQFMTFWFSFCSLVVSVMFLITGLIAEGETMDTVLCHADDPSQENIQSEGISWCVVQSAVVIFFSSAECAWWAIQAFDLYRKLVLGQRHTESWKLTYHMFAWTIPTIATASLLATENLGYSRGTGWCLIKPNDSPMIDWVGYFLFIALCFIFGVAMMIGVLYVICKHANRQAKTETNGSAAKFSKRFKMYRTPLYFVLAFILVWSNIFSYRIIGQVNFDDLKAQGRGWVACLTVNSLFTDSPAFDENQFTSLGTKMLIDPPEGTGCREYQGGLRRFTQRLVFLVVMGQSILVFVIFGVNKENFKLWATRFGLRDASSTTLYDDSKESEGSKGGSKQGSYYDGSKQGVGSFHETQNAGGANYGSQYGGSQYGGSQGGGFVNGTRRLMTSIRMQGAKVGFGSPPPPPPPAYR